MCTIAMPSGDGGAEMVEVHDPETVWRPFGPFSQLVICGRGRLVFLKGQVALDRDGRLVGEGDMATQVRQVLDNVAALLAAVGGRMSDIVSLTQYTTDIAAFLAAGDVRRAYVPPPYPVTTTVEVLALYDPAILVEIAAVAEIPEERFRVSAEATPLHG